MFSDELQQKYPCFKKGRSDFEAECITCGYGTFIFVANKGSISLNDHIKTTKHKQAIRGETSSSKMTDYFCKPGTKSEDEVAAAEATMAFHIVKHHYSYKSNDCTSTLMAKIFPDSSTAKKFSCARTKIEAIVNNVLAPASVQCVLNDIEKHEIMYLGVSLMAAITNLQNFFLLSYNILTGKMEACSLNCLMSEALKTKHL